MLEVRAAKGSDVGTAGVSCLPQVGHLERVSPNGGFVSQLQDCVGPGVLGIMRPTARHARLLAGTTMYGGRLIYETPASSDLHFKVTNASRI